MKKIREVHRVDDIEIIENIKSAKANNDEEKNIMLTFSLRLNDLLYKKNIHQEDFCEEMRIGTGALSNYRNGKRFPELFLISKIADKLNVSVDYLLGKSDCVDYKLDDMNKYLGLSEGALISLYRLRHSDFDSSIFRADNEKSEMYDDNLMLLSLLLSEPFVLSFLLEAIQKYIYKQNEIDELKNDEEYMNTILANERLKQEIEEADVLSYQVNQKLSRIINEIRGAFNESLFKKGEIEK